jgi:hypothetical protein
MTTVLQQVSDDLAATVEAVSPGLVRVEARSRFPASGMVWSPDGVIVTAHHVIEQDEAVRVGLHGGQTVTATLIGRDATTDLAVLRVATMELTRLPAEFDLPAACGTSRAGGGTAWAECPGDVGHCERARGALAHADWWSPRALCTDGRRHVPRVFWWAAGERGWPGARTQYVGPPPGAQPDRGNLDPPPCRRLLRAHGAP